MKTNILTILLVLITTLTAHPQTASKRPWLLSQGAAAREAKRFTLQEWLENKDRRALMDMWLSINTPSPFEFVMSAALQNYNLETASGGTLITRSHSVTNGEITAYARLVGVSLEHTNNPSEGFNDVTGIFNLRVFGDTLQGSHITFHYGLRTRTANDTSYRLNQPFPAATLQLYLMKYFGIQGNYRGFTPISESFYGDTTMDELTYGLFIEYGALRLFGDIYQERQNSKLGGVETNYKRNGARVGLKLYF